MAGIHLPTDRGSRMPHGKSGLSLTVVLLASSVVPAYAQTGWTGRFTDDWFLSGNWTAGFPRQTTDGIINTVVPNSTVIARPGALARNLDVGPNATGRLVIQTGGTLADSLGAIGNLPGGVGTVTVTGVGSSWSNAGDVVVGGQGKGTLSIQYGSTVQSGSASLGLTSGSTATVTVTGAGSKWTNGGSGGLNIGSSGKSSLTIANGGVVANISNRFAANIGAGAGSQGTVTVTGAGSAWINISGVNIGNRGTGTLTVADGGQVAGPVMIANIAGSTGTLNIGAGAEESPVAPGTLTAARIDFGAGTGTINFNHTATDYEFAPAISGNGAVDVLAGRTIFTAANTHTGATTVAAGALRAGAANAFSAASSHTVATGAMLDTGGFNQRVAALANSGTVSLAGANAGSTLTVTGSYFGNAGILRLGTDLPAIDRLVIDGATATARGTTSVQITTRGGLGALTTGDGIEVISARNGATTTVHTTKTAFSLAGGHVDAGAYEYRLEPGDAQGAGENWYLRSTVTVLPPVIPPLVPPGEVVPPGESGRPPVVSVTPPAIPPVQMPTYRAEVPLLAALPGQFRQADLAMLGNLHRRIGDEVPGASGTDLVTPPPSGLAEAGTRRAWGRLVYADLDVAQPGVAEARTAMRVSGLQAGTDLLVTDTWRAGVYLGYLDGNADVSGNAHGIFDTAVGSNDLNSRFLGAYATWMDAGGWYVDSVLQGASHRYEIRPDGNPRVSGKASGFTASVESGKAFALNERWSIEPQAQLAWQHNSIDDLLLAGARVQQDSASGWIARLGVRIKGDLVTTAGRLQPYGRLNFYHANFGGDAALFIGPAASTAIASEGSYSAGEIAAGATLALTSTTSLYGEIGHQWNIGGDASVKSSVQGSLGIKVRW